MKPQKKVAVAEVCISILAISTAIVVYPWLGERSSGMFGLLGLLGLTPLFLVRRSGELVADERDQMIAQKATFFSFGTGWMILYFSVMVLVFFVGNDRSVPTGALMLALWVSFSLSYVVKGVATLLLYGTEHAA